MSIGTVRISFGALSEKIAIYEVLALFRPLFADVATLGYSEC